MARGIWPNGLKYMRMCAYKIHKFENIQNGNMLKEEKKQFLIIFMILLLF